MLHVTWKRELSDCERKAKATKFVNYGGFPRDPMSLLFTLPLPPLPRDQPPILKRDRQTWRRRSGTPRDTCTSIPGAARTETCGRGGSACSRRRRERFLRGRKVEVINHRDGIEETIKRKGREGRKSGAQRRATERNLLRK